MFRASCKDFPEGRSFGVEMEVSNTISKVQIGNLLKLYEVQFLDPTWVVITGGKKGWAETVYNDYWHVKYDSTCGPKGKGKDYGWEIASYIGLFAHDIDRIANAAQFLASHNVEINNNCGLHVHVEVKDFTVGRMGILLARWLKIENVLRAICSASRQDNFYCRSLSQRALFANYDFKQTKQFWYCMSPCDFSAHDNNDKKFALNSVGYAAFKSHSYHAKPTIELRLPECLLEADHIRNWITIFLNFVATSKIAAAPKTIDPFDKIKDIIRYLGLAKRGNMILSERLFLAQNWFLNKVINSNFTTENQKKEAKKLLQNS